MRKFKVNRNQNDLKIPTKETMEKYKDFSKLSHKYENLTKRPKKPIYKDPKWFIALILIVVVVYLVTNSDKEGSKNSDKQKIENRK